jgi:hypothetical protein
MRVILSTNDTPHPTLSLKGRGLTEFAKYIVPLFFKKKAREESGQKNEMGS